MPARVLYGSCPLCGDTKLLEERVADCSWHPLYQPALGASIRWLRCGGCAHVFAEGFFGPEVLPLLLERVPASQRVGEGLQEARPLAGRMVERVNALRAALGADQRDLAQKPGRWLDVGFGNAALLLTAAEFGYKAVGLDLRSVHVEALRALGFEAHQGELDAFDPGAARPDVISLCDVLEHMPFPKAALLRARELAAPSAVLLISTPNAEAPIWKQMDAGGANPYWGELEHLHNFGRARLFALLAECGLAPCGYAASERYLAGMEILAVRA